MKDKVFITLQHSTLPRYIRRAIQKKALLEGRDAFQAGYEAGFTSGRAHGQKEGYATAIKEIEVEIDRERAAGERMATPEELAGIDAASLINQKEENTDG